MIIKYGVLKKVKKSDIVNGFFEVPEGVTSIGESAFERCASLTSIKIPESVTSIGGSAFSRCSSLTSIEIPESVTSIGYRAFGECTSLTSIEIPESVKSIGGSAFSRCSSLTSIEIPESVTSIGYQAFEKCTSLTSIEIPESVTSIGESAFEKCTSLTRIKIPESVTFIDDVAFCGCTSLTSIEIPESVTSIGYRAFEECTSLTSIEIPESVTSIGESTFGKCTSLTRIKIPESVTFIGDAAFARCTSLTSIEIPESVTRIGASAFYYCTNLTSIEIPESVTSIENDTFSECTSLTRIKIPESVTSIGASAFARCTSLTRIKIPDSVTSIGASAFDRCTSLTSIEIPESVTSIGNRAFCECTNLTSIKIPDSCMSIGEEIFAGCTSLTSIKIPENINEDVLMELCLQCNTEERKFVDERLVFGEDLERFYEIRKNAKFNQSRDFESEFMDRLYHKIIMSVGIDALERMAKVPDHIDEKTIETYMLRREEQYKELYEEKQKISGDFEVTLTLIKTIMSFAGTKNDTNKNGVVVYFKALNQLLEEHDTNGINTLTKLFEEIQKKVNVERPISKEEIEKIKALEQEFQGKQFKINIEQTRSMIKAALQTADSETGEIFHGKQIKKNIEQIRSMIKEALQTADSKTGEMLAELQIEPIQIIIEKVLKRVYKENGTLEVENLSQLLKEELLSETHSLYIRHNAEQIVNRFMNLYENNQDFRKKINQNTITSLINMKNNLQQSGKKRWIMEIIRAFEKLKDKEGNTRKLERENLEETYSEDEIKILSEALGITIQTQSVAVLKEGIALEEVYKIIEAAQENMPEEERFIVTYKQLHDMFGGVHAPYSEKFRVFFAEHMEEFLRDPRYIDKFATICNNFETIINSDLLKNKYLNGNLELEDIMRYLGSIRYTNQRKGDEKLVQYASLAGIMTDEEFEEVQKIADIVKNRERTSIPPLYVQKKENKFRGRMLSPNDILAMFVGNLTDCCQKFGDAGMGAMLLGAIEENAGIFVVEELQEDGTYKIIGQSLTIRQKGTKGHYDRLTFDNIEIAENVKSRLSRSDQEEILEIYQTAGKQAIELDKKFITRLLQEGKITQEMFDSLVLKEVIAGRGYNDLDILDTLEEAETVVPDEAFYKYRTKRWGVVLPWIDSTESGVPAGSNSHQPVLIASIDEQEKEQIEERLSNRNQDKPNKPTKLSKVPEWYGKVDEVQEYKYEEITEEEIEIIKKIEKKVYRPAQQLMNNNEVTTGDEIRDCYGIDEPTVVIGSEKTWYLIYGTTNGKDVVIQDLVLDGGNNSDKNPENEETKQASMMAITEMADYLYGLLITSAKEGKKITCNATKDTSLINIKNMLRKGLIEIYDKKGKKIILSEDRKLQYGDGSEVEYRDFENSNDDSIEMLDLELRPNIKKMVEERKKIQDLLRKAEERKRMEGTKKEEDLDELRRELRDDLEI